MLSYENAFSFRPRGNDLKRITIEAHATRQSDSKQQLTG